jgi:hypothetical protein
MLITLHHSSQGIRADYCATLLIYGLGDVIDGGRAVEENLNQLHHNALHVLILIMDL